MSAELVAEWVRKAEEDWIALARLRRGGLAAVADVVAFHCQQSAEKYLKALIQHEGGEPPRTHQLGTLLDRLATARPEIEELRDPCERLAPYAVHFRYPGEQAREEDAAEAVRYATQIRTALRAALSLDSPDGPS